MGQNTFHSLGRAVEELEAIRLTAYWLGRRTAARGLRGLTDVLALYPAVSAYFELVSWYRRPSERVAYHAALARRLKGYRAAEEFSEASAGRHEEAFRALVAVGCLLHLGYFRYAKEKLRAAALDGKGNEEALSEALEFIGASRALERRLHRHRRREGCALDLGALYQALAEADDAAVDGLHKYRPTGDPIAFLRALPFLAGAAVTKHARSLLRSDYQAEAAERLVSSLDEQPWLDPEDPSPGPEESLLLAEQKREVKAALRKRVAGLLTSKQQQVVLEYWRALEKGHRLSGKLENSMRQVWGTDYTKKRRMLLRIRREHPALADAIEAFATSRTSRPLR